MAPMSATVIPSYACSSRLEHKSRKQAFYRLASIVLRPRTHSHQLLQRTAWTLCSGRPWSCVPPEQGQPPTCQRPPVPPSSSSAQACRAGAGDPGGLLSRGFLKPLERIHFLCLFSLTPTSLRNAHFCQWWLESPVLPLLSLKDK